MQEDLQWLTVPIADLVRSRPASAPAWPSHHCRPWAVGLWIHRWLQPRTALANEIKADPALSTAQIVSDVMNRLRTGGYTAGP
jgi:hypothetical protein